MQLKNLSRKITAQMAGTGPLTPRPRRRFLGLLGALPLAGCAIVPSQAAADSQTASELQSKTPSETEGPFYPPVWEGDIDNDLLRIASQEQYDSGTVLHLSGRITRNDGTPVTDARVAIWQTDNTGRYRHPNDAGEKPAQTGFQGYGQATTDSDGRYRFRTIKPVAYGSRPPHVHFRIDDGENRLTTQMYFPNETDEKGLLGRVGALWASDRSLLTAQVTPAKTGNGQDANFDIRL